MRVLISVSSHKRYGDIVRDYQMPLDLPIYVPEYEEPPSGVRREIVGLAHEPVILMGAFYNEEYNYLAGNSCRIFELTEVDWGGMDAEESGLQQEESADEN